MAPRTRATAAAPAAGLSAAPRRRVKVVQLDANTAAPKEAEKPTRATRATRSTKEIVSEPVELAPRTRGRPKKIVKPEPEPELKPEKPKRTIRTASVADEKPKRATRAAKLTVLVPTAEEESSKAEISKVQPRKKVTFEIAENDKENVPVGRATRKTAKSKEMEQPETSIKAKPVRKAAMAAASTAKAGKKRVRDTTEDQVEKTRPTKRVLNKSRVLTPKKITQVARAPTSEEASEDELHGGKTPVRDLSLSPRRPPVAGTVTAITQRLSPVKKLEFTLMAAQPVQRSYQTDAPLTSPARRPPMSPAKVVASLQYHRVEDESTSIASPARRLPHVSQLAVSMASLAPIEQSPRRGLEHASRLLFPSHNSSLVENPQLKGSQTLLQSPKRSGAFSATKFFPKSANKSVSNSSGLFKSSTLSSPAKRLGLFSPLKRSVVTVHEDETMTNERLHTPTASHTTLELPATVREEDLHPLNVDAANLIQAEQNAELVAEFTVTSHQRASTSPNRPVRLSPTVLSPGHVEVDFNDSILDIRSPLKVTRSPIETSQPAADDDETILMAETTDNSMMAELAFPEITQSVRSTPQKLTDNEFLEGPASTPQSTSMAQFVNFDTPSTIVQSTPIEKHQENVDVNVAIEDFTVVADDQQVDDDVEGPFDTSAAVVAQGQPKTPIFVKTSRPASLSDRLAEHESTSVARSHEAKLIDSPAGLVEHELTILANIETPDTPLPTEGQTMTPASLYEHELTKLGINRTPGLQATPSSLRVRELDTLRTTRTEIFEQSPAVLCQHELTMMADAVNPHAAQSPASLEEGELTLLAANDMSVSNSADRDDTTRIELLQDASALAEATNPFAPPQAKTTPQQPVLRKFNLHTTISKVPLKAAMDSPSASPLAMSMLKKRKRAASFGSADNGHIETPTRISLIQSSTNSKSSSRTPLAPVSKPSETGVLSGVAAYLDIRTSHNADASQIYSDIITQFGGRVISRWTESITHVVYKSTSTRTLDRVAEAITAGHSIKVVGLSWVLDCQKRNTWLDETPYLVDISSLESLATRSVGRGRSNARRRTLDPNMVRIVADGSVQRSSSLSRVLSTGDRRSTVSVTARSDSTDSNLDTVSVASHPADVENQENVPTPEPASAPRSEASHKLNKPRESLAEAWSHIPSAEGLDLGADTPARKTLDLLQRSYNLENSINEEETMVCEDETIIETGLTPAPYRARAIEVPGSAPAKAIGAGFMSMKQRMEEMERREARRGGKDRRQTVFGSGLR